MSRRRGGGVSPLTKSLLVAALLHAGLLGYMAYFSPPPMPPASPQEPLVWVDVPPEPSPAEPQPATPSEGESDEAEERVAAMAPPSLAGPSEPGAEASAQGEESKS